MGMEVGMVGIMLQKQRSCLPSIQVPPEVAQDWCKEKNIPYFEVSAKNDINVVQAFEMLASRALSRVSGCGGSTWPGGPLGWGNLGVSRTEHIGHG